MSASPNTYNVTNMLAKMSSELTTLKTKGVITDPIMIGIHTAGVWIAEALHQHLSITEPLGELNISFYRDDFSRIGLHPQIKPSNLPFEIEDRDIILVDDVLYTGRTIRAAMNEIFDYGRPASITLAVLIDRGHHELPIEAQVVGLRQTMDADSYFKLSKDNKHLELDVIHREQK